MSLLTAMVPPPAASAPPSGAPPPGEPPGGPPFHRALADHLARTAPAEGHKQSTGESAARAGTPAPELW